MRKLLCLLALAFTTLSACGSDPGPAGPQAPSGLTYPLNPATYTRNTAIAANAPTHAGGDVTTYSVNPALPTGLTLDPSTGILSGTPTEITGQAVYAVTATGPGGSTTANLTLTVNDIPPSGLAYSQPYPTYYRWSPITANTPTSAGGAVVDYAISPALPPGLTFDSATGWIAGTPRNYAPATTYTITASNSGGSTTADVVFEVSLPYPHHLYVADQDGARVRIYAMNATTGALTTLTPVAAADPTVAAHPNGDLVFVTARVSLNYRLFSYSTDHATGALAQADAVVMGDLSTLPRIATVDPLGRFVYVKEPASYRPFAVDGTTGLLTARSTLSWTSGSATYQSAAIDASGRFLFQTVLSGLVTMFNIAADGTLASSSSYSSSGSLAAHPFRPFLYATTPGLSGFTGAKAIRTFPIDETAGSLGAPAIATSIGTNPLVTAVDSAGRFAYVADVGANEILSFTIDPANGTLTRVGSGIATGNSTYGLQVDPSGKFVVAICYGGTGTAWGSVRVYKIGTDGSLTHLQTIGGEAAGTPIGSCAVPGPTSLAFTFGATPLP